MRTPLARITAFYGAHPLHLLTLLACFALAGYAALHTATDPQWPVMLGWFLAAVVGHDLVLFPVYTLADRTLTTVLHVLRPRRKTTPAVAATNHLRVPALAAGLLFLLFFPGIIEQGRDTYLAATGQTQQPYLARWLLLTATLFATSAVVYAMRLWRHRPDRVPRPDPRKSKTGCSRPGRGVERPGKPARGTRGGSS